MIPPQVIAAGIGALTSALQLLFRNRRPNGTAFVNEAERLLTDYAYQSAPAAAQAAFFDDVWGKVVQHCTAIGDSRCITDRQRGGKFDWFRAYRPVNQGPGEPSVGSGTAPIFGTAAPAAPAAPALALLNQAVEWYRANPESNRGVIYTVPAPGGSALVGAGGGWRNWESLGPYDPAFRSRFTRLTSGLKRAGITFKATSGFRTRAQQEAACRSTPWLCATPGTSNHERGRAVDGRWFIRGIQVLDSELPKLDQVARLVGIRWAGQTDPVHWELM